MKDGYADRTVARLAPAKTSRHLRELLLTRLEIAGSGKSKPSAVVPAE